MLLPHGYEGQGPEHSSARLERYLQLCAENNLQVCYPSTPAQYFHLLRRQVTPGMDRPLIVRPPKMLLRLPAASSTLEQLGSGGFQPVIDDAEITDRNRVQRIVLCSGKVFYDLTQARSRGRTVREGSAGGSSPTASDSGERGSSPTVKEGSDATAEIDASQAVADRVAIIRAEQFYPYPQKLLTELIHSYPNATELVWAQEEPQNMG